MSTNEKLTQLPSVSETQGADLVYCVQSGISVQESIAQQSAYYQTVMLPLAGGTMTGNINLGGFDINNGTLAASVQVPVGSLIQLQILLAYR
jgi:hypothetical protein